LESAVSLPPETVGLRWYLPDGSGTYVDTTATLSVGGAPISATLRADPEDGCPQFITVEGAMLRLQSVDGAFDEVIPGQLYNDTDFVRAADHQYKLRFHAGGWSTTFAGTYDPPIDRPLIYLLTNLSPAYGSMQVNSGSGTYQKPVAVADWRPAGI
jgi:hypothetical protein